MSKAQTYFNWSSGKDAALALYYLQQQDQLAIDKLLTTVNSHHNRVSMHGLGRELLEAQAKAVGIPLQTLELPEEPSMDEYNRLMKQTVEGLKNDGYTDCVFGDIFLEDLRLYREKQLEEYAIQVHFPLWKKNTHSLMEEFIELGFKAVVLCVDNQKLGRAFLGREINTSFLNDLPKDVDPCGENGEFHTFCYDGPIFKHKVDFEIGASVFREYNNPSSQKSNKPSTIGFWFCDLIKP